MVNDLADACRAKGIAHLEITTAAGHVVMTLGSPPPAPPRERTAQEIAADEVNAKRASLWRTLGREPTDDEMRNLAGIL